MKTYEFLSNTLIVLSEYVGLMIKFCGLTLIVYAFIKLVIKIFKVHKLDASKINLDSEFNHYLSAALEILLASEIIETIAQQTISTLIEIVVLIAIRVLISFVLTLEDKEKTKKLKEEKLILIQDNEKENKNNKKTTKK